MIETIPPIILKVETPASADGVWAALTEPDPFAEWLTDASQLGAVGDAYRLDFGDGSVVEGIIREIEPRASLRPHVGVGGRAPAPGDDRRLDRGGPARRWRPGHIRPRRWAEAGADSASRDDHEAYWSGFLDDLIEILAERA